MEADPIYERILYGDLKKNNNNNNNNLSPEEPVYESIPDALLNSKLSPECNEPVYACLADEELLESILASAPQQNQQPNLDSMLGSLQTTMSKQGVATVTKGTCAGCNKPIIGQVRFVFL